MLILRKVLSLYNSTFNENLDSRTKDRFLAGSPLPVLIIIVAYFYIVLGNGQRFMKRRHAFDLGNVIIAYNLFQIVGNAYVFYMIAMYSSQLDGFEYFCLPIARYDFSSTGNLCLSVSYFFFLLKVIDLLETLFFILRKKNRQVSFLHIYHHAGMVIAGYFYFKLYSGGGYAILLGLCNSFVHVIMYGYYFLTAYRPELKKSVWWKKHITQLQLFQFSIYFVYCIISILFSDCKNSKIFIYGGLVQAVVMTTLFSDFYYKTYIKSKESK